MNSGNELSLPDTLRVMVLSVIADDYESFPIIAHETSEWAGQIGLAVNHEKILDALEGLILEGLAKAYVLSSHKPHAVSVTFSRELSWDHWYWITSDGKQLLEHLQTKHDSLFDPALIERTAYEGFEILTDVVVDGFTLGKITDFEVEPNETGDSFVIAPDGSRAGLVWAVSEDSCFEYVVGRDGKWGVWLVAFPYPMTNRDNARRNLESVLPELKREWEQWRPRRGSQSL
jgi:hypothetical protein